MIIKNRLFYLAYKKETFQPDNHYQSQNLESKHFKDLFSTTQDTTVKLKFIQHFILNRYIAAISPSYDPI